MLKIHHDIFIQCENFKIMNCLIVMENKLESKYIFLLIITKMLRISPRGLICFKRILQKGLFEGGLFEGGGLIEALQYS